MHWKLLIAVGLIAGLVLQGTMVQAAKVGDVQAATGKVVAVTEGSKTVVIESTLNGQPWLIGAHVADDTKFSGKAKGLSDLKPGDRVTVQWVTQEHGAVARSIAAR